ncbi:MAG: thiamine pyrophosphate-dependent enzyme [Bacteroidales bacterium]|jgi:pyruvate/2-oxoglutarate/acetoin dehydrogenase E1 component/TPP-dependent pyruvate/acetoin dehydrogenase alpha subunit|nr:thiamine pyrophosphate-dependent enzyme [Bacteroidales bacterium]
MSTQSKDKKNSNTKMSWDKKEVLKDYKLANLSRQISLLGRKEVLTGKAKFGIFGDGKEIAQIAMAKQYKDGDWRSGYYRDQTFMMAAGLFTAEEFFAQLYGETDINLNPGNGGRSFNNHFSTRSLNPDGSWKDLMKQKNSSADISPTAGQMARWVGLAYASKLFRNVKEMQEFKNLSDNGNEVAFGTIGDASTSEGQFWEAINAVGVLQVPAVIAVWDDGYGISVPKKFQTTKGSISEVLKGFERTKDKPGIVLLKGKGWDYPGMIELFEKGVEIARKEHVPVVFHIDEITQPQGHSTSGSHERYKSEERLKWEEEYDGIQKTRAWIIKEKIATEKELAQIEQEAIEEAKAAKKTAWKKFKDPVKAERDKLIEIIDNRSCMCKREGIDKVGMYSNELKKIMNPIRKDIFSTAKKILRHVCTDCNIREKLQRDLSDWLERNYEDNYERYNTRLNNEYPTSALNVSEVKPKIKPDSPEVAGREILRDNFDYLFKKYPRLVAFGEDLGNIGGVNQTYQGLQEKYGELRLSDTGIREQTILGQGIGLALRGLRPIAEIQYFDYLLYALQTLSDDLATTHYRTAGGQVAPVIISTRGHRLEGIWHAGSPLSMVINSIRGVYVCVPRNMTQAAGFYNTLMEGEDPALVIEPLNGYRLKEKRPENIGEYKIPLGVPEILNEGTDVTLVTYGSCVRIAQDAVEQLKEFDISVELIDVQTLLPFDRKHIITDSIKKTNKVVFFDEDVPGGATAFMMQKVLEDQAAYYYLDSEPRTVTAKEHRPAYTSDGDYFSNPNAEDVFEAIYAMMNEVDPKKHPELY